MQKSSLRESLDERSYRRVVKMRINSEAFSMPLNVVQGPVLRANG